MCTKINLTNVSMSFNIYNTPMDRLKEALSITHRKRHVEFNVLNDISLKVDKGEILGIVGKNGAGKSTLLKIITGIYEPQKGKVEVNGRISSLLELGIGFNLELSGIDNIYFYGSLFGISREAMKAKIQYIIDFAEIGKYIYQPVKTYSSGMFARLAFSCAISIEPDILIVDEILSVGDMRFQSKCFNKFREFQEAGVTVLYVGHDVGLMREFCSRCIWINDGKIEMSGKPQYVTAKFTEFMYLDDAASKTGIESSEIKRNLDIGTNVENIERNNIVKDESNKFPDALAHWGTKQGLIKSVRMLNDKNEEANYFDPYETVSIVIQYEGFVEEQQKDVSVAVSIKNREGADLCVITTYDKNIKLNNEENQEICFKFKPMLARGDYYLVVAIEDREKVNPIYYEYIEGTNFFKMFSEKKIFGIYDVDAKITLRKIGE